MTATPIPRTLYMALTGIRDLSLISTPPQERVPIRTFVTARNESLVREAILREMSRGGQVFFVHNRVQSIYRIREWLEELVPEASVGIGHGQMDESELEHAVLAFMQREYDVLLCTTIIESGVDIPNANTIIMDNAHALGLTQLYQLRGRVGRGNVRAYAYLLYPPHTPLSAEARQRLAAIQEATELGAGFQIAMRDMGIRGAGNILGAEQSGHIAAVGLDLYTRMLSHAIEELRAGRPILEPEDVNLDVAIDARIPESYIADESTRLTIYHRVASASTPRELGELKAELTDRFGSPPREVERIFDLVRMRHTASELGITSLIERDGVIFIRPVVGGRLDANRLKQALGPGVRVTPNQVRLTLNDLNVGRWEAIQMVLRAVEEVRSGVLAAS
jgi:transcription-repair coupling factor (superfamily II helicase)